jgi:hypothetical protein
MPTLVGNLYGELIGCAKAELRQIPKIRTTTHSTVLGCIFRPPFVRAVCLP